MNKSIKSILYDQCLLFVEERIANVKQAIENVSDFGNDTKSSAGDKHETGIAMAQLEQEKSAKQLLESIELKNNLLKIDPEQKSATALLGSLVFTNKEVFYISISAGKLIVDNKVYYAISPTSPVALRLKGLSAGQEAEFNGIIYKVEKVC